MELREKILERSSEKIAMMQRAEECPKHIREKAIMKRQVSKQILEIICGIQGMTPNTAIQILNEAKSTIDEVVHTVISEVTMSQKV